jgi:hypothetical protein
LGHSSKGRQKFLHDTLLLGAVFGAVFFVKSFKQPETSDQGKVVALERKSAGELARSLYSLH